MCTSPPTVQRTHSTDLLQCSTHTVDRLVSGVPSLHPDWGVRISARQDGGEQLHAQQASYLAFICIFPQSPGDSFPFPIDPHDHVKPLFPNWLAILTRPFQTLLSSNLSPRLSSSKQRLLAHTPLPLSFGLERNGAACHSDGLFIHQYPQKPPGILCSCQAQGKASRRLRQLPQIQDKMLGRRSLFDLSALRADVYVQPRFEAWSAQGQQK